MARPVVLPPSLGWTTGKPTRDVESREVIGDCIPRMVEGLEFFLPLMLVPLTVELTFFMSLEAREWPPDTDPA